MEEVIFDLKGVSRIYAENTEIEVRAVQNVDLQIKRGEFSALVGPSGSGKSTLLNLMSGLDHPTHGTIKLVGKELSSMSETELSDYRRDHIGFVFQSYNLIPVLTVKENIEYVMLLQGIEANERHQRVKDILAAIGLEGKESKFPDKLSGGQQQRVAVARAIVAKPDIILADEPTANLDSKTGKDLLDLMHDLNKSSGITFVFSTHDQAIMDRANRLIKLRDGKVIDA